MKRLPAHCVRWEDLNDTVYQSNKNVTKVILILLRVSVGDFPLYSSADGRRCCYKCQTLYIKVDNKILK